MNKIKSFIFGDHSDTKRLIRSESVSSVSEPRVEQPSECASDCLDGNQEFSANTHMLDHDTPITEERVMEPLLSRPRYQQNHREFFDYYSVTQRPNYLESLVPDESARIASCFHNPSITLDTSSSCRDGTWRVLLRCHHSSRKVKGKIWRPIVVKLEEASLNFHAQGFESSPPFKVISLTWFHIFRAPKYQESSAGCHRNVLTTVLLNTFQGSRQKWKSLTCPIWGKTAGQKVAKIGCADHKVLLDFIETVQRCIFSFPGFRQRGIHYKKNRVFVDVQEVYEQREGKEVANSEAYIKVITRVSGSPECRIILNRFAGQTDLREIGFHSCVKAVKGSRRLGEPLTATFVPLDNCWFQLVHLKSFTSRPPPLRCQVTVVVRGTNWIELRAQIFPTTRLDAASASNIVLRFHVPPSWLQSGKKSREKVVQQSASVSKGKVRYSSTNETMLWSIHKLPLQHKSCHRNEKPSASLSVNFKPAVPSNPEQIFKMPVEMDFAMSGKSIASEVSISGMTMWDRKFEDFKTQYSSIFRILVPVEVSNS